MKTKIKDIKGKDCPPGKIHYLRYAVGPYTVTTQCDKTFESNEWKYTEDKVNCPACLLATIKRKSDGRTSKK